MSIEQLSIWGALTILALTILFIASSPFWGWRLPRHRRLYEALPSLKEFSLPTDQFTTSDRINVDKIVQNAGLSNRIIVVSHVHSSVREFFRSASRQAMLYMLGAVVVSAIGFIIIGRLPLPHESTFHMSAVIICGIFFAGLEAILLLVFLAQYQMIATQVDKYEDLFS